MSVRSMAHTLAEPCSDRPRICVVSVSRDPIRHYAGGPLYFQLEADLHDLGGRNPEISRW
jgi:hypothetical protein